MYGISTIPRLNYNSTIFKTITSSVDETRKTLALFNKDWNTYRTNWEKGYSQNGFAGGVKSIFQSSSQNSVISKDQVQILRNWNNAVKRGCTDQATFNRIIANADENTKMYFAGLNKGKGSIEGLKNAQNVAKQSTIGLTIAQTALNMAISMGLMAAISLAIKGFDKLINSAKRASEAANEAFSDTSEKVQQNEEETKSLDELISKYKELKESGNLDIDGRKEIKELQNDIADLVGIQAKNLDLVNGKLDDEIKKLDEISAKEAKDAYETATANYFNSQKANKNASGDDSYAFFDGYAYIGKKEKEPIKILQDAGFNNAVQIGGVNPFNQQVFVMDTFVKGAQEKADYLQSMIDVLEQNGQRATDLYAGLIKQRDAYLKYIDNQQNAANSLVDSWIIYSQFSNEELSKINVDSVESFDAYRQKMIEEAKNDESIGKMLADGTLSDEDLEKAVNDFMATSLNFSKWYEQWLGNVQDSTSGHKAYILSNLTNAGLSQNIAQQVVDGFSDADIQAIIDAKDIDWSKMVEGFTDVIVNSDWNEVAKKYGEALSKGREYADSLTASQKKSGNVSNVEDNVLIIGTNTTKEQEDVLAQWKAQYSNLQLDKGTARYEKNVIQYRESIDDVRIGAVPTFYTEDGKAEILTPESLSNYLKSVYAEASKLAGGATPENILKVDQNGIKQDINGVTKTVSNMIYAVEGMVVDGIEMTADDVDKKSKERTNILENSIPKEAIAEINNVAEQYGTSVNDIVANNKKLDNASSEIADNIIDSVSKAGTITFDDIFDLQDDIENKLTPLGEANKQIDELQNAYKGLKEAMDSYNETGYFTVDQVQSIISYGGEYLKYLMDENGNLQLNEETLDRVAEARINEMRAKAITNLFDVLKNINGEIEAQSYLEQQLYETSDAYDALTENKIKDWRATLLEKNISADTADALESSVRKQASAINEMFDNINLNSFHGSVSKSSKDASDSAKEQISSYMEYMKQSLEIGRIDYKTYCRDVTNYLNDMYTKGKMSLKEYHDYAKQMFETQKDIYDKALSAITGLLDDEIDKYEECIKTVEKQNDALEKQKTLMENAASVVSNYYQKLIQEIEDTNDAIEEQSNKLEEQLSDMDDVISAVVKYYDSLIDADQKAIDNLGERNDLIKEQIEKYDSLISVADRLYEEEQENLKSEQDAIQDKIDLLQEENDQKDLQYRKEQALYELHRSQQQRNKKIYVGDKGVIYDTDKSEISDAKKNLQDIQTEELVNSLEKEKEALQESIDSLQEYRDALSEVSSAYQKLVDERNTIELVGEDYKNAILETSIEDWNKLKDKYIQSNDEITDNETLIKSRENNISNLEDEKEKWSSLTQSITDNINKQKAIEQFGLDWETKINSGRFDAFDSFKEKYLNIQSQINDNTEIVNSNNKKIEQYNILKEQWDSLSNALSDNTNRQAAIQLFGSDFEKQINEGRIQSFESFKEQYLNIQSQINDNTQTINSYNEKIEYYNSLKSQWSDVSSAYENETNRQYAAMILGADWESKILSGRIDTLNNFAREYSDIQRKIQEEAWASANAQIEAANAVANRTDYTPKKPKDDPDEDIDEDILKNKYGSNAFGGGKWVRQKYASGTTNAKKGLNLVGEDGIETFIDNDGNISLVTEPTLIPMEGGEIVKNESETKSLLDGSNLVPLQTSDLFKKLSVNMPDLSSMFKTNIPDYSNLVMRNNNVQQPSIVIGDIHLHEVQNVDGLANAIIRELPNKVTQALGKR